MKMTKRQLIKLIKEQTSLKIDQNKLHDFIIKRFETGITKILGRGDLIEEIADKFFKELDLAHKENQQLLEAIENSLGAVAYKLKLSVDSIVKSTFK